MRRKFLPVLALCLTAAPLRSEEAKPEITLLKIKANEVEKAVAAHKGKVVVIDVWAEFCAPCKKNFPHLVHLHKQYAKEGLVCISLSVDPEEAFKDALGFLQKQDARFTNYILLDTDENKDVLEKRIENISPPIFHVFDRTGKKVRTWEGRIENDKIDELVKKLLSEK